MHNQTNILLIAITAKCPTKHSWLKLTNVQNINFLGHLKKKTESESAEE